jgi:hypothetical protein
MERSELTCSRTGTWLLPEAGDSARPWTTARFSLAEPVPSHLQALEQRRRNAPRGAMIRKPSCFNSCSQPSPLGTRSARTGWQGGMKPGGTRRRQAGTGERTNIGRICAGRAGSGVPATIGSAVFFGSVLSLNVAEKKKGGLRRPFEVWKENAPVTAHHQGPRGRTAVPDGPIFAGPGS